MGDPAPVRDSATCFRAGRVVARTFAVWSRTLPQLLLISALVHVPVVALMFWLRRMDEFSLPRTLLVRTLPSLEATAVTKCCEGFAVLLVFRRLRGERPDLVRSLREGLRRLVTIAVVATLLAVAFLVPTLVVWLRIWTDRATTATGTDLARIGAFAIYAVYALVFSVPIPAALVEGRGPFAAFVRSLRLTSGRRAPIFWVFVLFNLFTQIPTRMLFWIVPELHSVPAAIVVNVAIETLLASLTCVLPIVLYHDLRETKEGVGIEELVQVFA